MSQPDMQLTESMMEQSETFVCPNWADAGPGNPAHVPGFVPEHCSSYEMLFFDMNADTVPTAPFAGVSTAMLPEYVEFCGERKAEKLDVRMIAAMIKAW
ncbi:hypothetical protein [Paenibacillus sp. DMB20]|uniref:hypothetical protein n=1 Tax=Paenibacillus sp. DMB20 TaxID=1642570 RepID=UPI0006277947|nr:hypothetical protein [Paenibacillus sp. DMB20]KKO51502.1 hypothetical protein XI25_25710 [Paenibacillus sp. DMB20]